MKLMLVQGQYANSWESQGLGFIGAYVHKYRPDVTIGFFHGNMDTEEEIVQGCRGADIVAFSCTSPSYSYARGIAKRLKVQNPGVWTVLGGYHASALRGLALCKELDQVVVGEGEEAMLSIVAGNHDPVVTGVPMLFKDLPWVDRELICNERHIEVAFRDTGKRITSFQAHRGCPFYCRFCADGKLKTLYGGTPPPPRHRNTQDLLNEIEVVTEKYQLDLVKFCDPTWNLGFNWIKEFCESKMDRNLRVPFFSNIHARHCSLEMFQLMQRAGCSEIGLGVESGSEKVLAAIGKGITKESVFNAASWAKSVGIKVRGYFILGMPEETEEDLRLTEEFAAELALDEYGFTLLCPYPGTDFYNYDIMHSRDWEGVDEYSNDFWRTLTLTNADLKRWQQRLVDRFAKKLTWHQRQTNEAS